MPIQLNGSTSGSVQVDVPAAVSGGDVSLTLPNGVGSANQFLKNSGTAGTLEFAALAGSNMPAGSILQVVQAVKTDTFSSSATGPFIDVTGLQPSITPSATSSKVLVSCYVNFGTASDDIRLAARIVREESGSDSIISQGDADGSRTRAMWIGRHPNLNGGTEHVNIEFLDSPSSTNTLTYKFQMGRIDGGTLIINDGRADSNSSNHARPISTVTLMEVAA
tara:strand:- start:4814 stop:5476 length:663 start_codon:yes stop_codon:yes gene_type:complete